MPDPMQSVAANLLHLQRQVNRRNTAQPGPMRLEPGDGFIQFVNGAGVSILTLTPEAATILHKAGQVNLVTLLEGTVDDIAAEKTARVGGDANLRDAIAAESAARVGGDNNLQNNINTVESRRVAADQAEKTARAGGDRNLQNNINTVEGRRISTDQTLRNAISKLATTASVNAALAVLNNRISALENRPPPSPPLSDDVSLPPMPTWPSLPDPDYN